jgi:hypothetical protein
MRYVHLIAAAGRCDGLVKGELSDDWRPTGSHATVWEACQYLIKRLIEVSVLEIM